jgi:DNA-binding transcriptional ArsR family regulator
MEPVQKKIVDALADSSKTISDLSKATGIHRVTVSKHAGLLEANGVLKHQQVGKAKVYSLNKKGKKVGKPKREKRKPRGDQERIVRKLVARELLKKKIVSKEEAVEIAGVPESEFDALLSGGK